MKRRLLAIFTAAPILLGLAACSSDSTQQADYARICVDEETQVRVEGERCGTNDSTASSGFLWWYLIYGRALPGFGYPVSGGYRTVSSTSVIEHDERYAPNGGKAYSTAPTRSYSSGNGKTLGTTKGGTGYKAPAKPAAPKVNNPAPKAPAPAAPKAPAYKAPAPAAPRPVAPAPRPPAPVKIR